jgi:sugar lactone lactonase YvrE
MKFETLATGYCFLEAPRADGEGLWFSDIMLGGLYHWQPGRGVERHLPERRHIGGIAINEDGAIICGGPDGLAWFDPATGRSGTLLDSIGGRQIGVNDMLPDGRGGLIFGTLTTADADAATAATNSLYRHDPDGRTTLLASGLKIANGIGLSPDGRRLYHNESLVGTFAYEVHGDGSLGEPQLFWASGDGDGLAVDAEGGIWIASFAGGEIVRLLPDGSVERRIAMPHKVVSSLCFGGTDWRDLYVTTGGNEGVDAMLRGEQPPREAALFHARSDIPGLPVARTRFQLSSP